MHLGTLTRRATTVDSTFLAKQLILGRAIATGLYNITIFNKSSNMFPRWMKYQVRPCTFLLEPHSFIYDVEVG